MKIGIKGFVFGVLTVVILMSTPVFAEDVIKTIQAKFNEISLEVNGEKVESDNILYNGTTYVPFRNVAELLDKNVDYISATKTASITDENAAKKRYEIDLTEETLNKAEKNVEEIAQLSNSIVKIEVDDFNGNLKSGSGVFINDEGYILTNYHVISEAFTYRVIIDDEDEQNLEAELIHFDSEVDLALLKVDMESKGLNISSVKPNVGSNAVVIGSPLGIFNTVSEGIISGFTNEDGIDSVITSAPVSSGNSGGALLNTYGEVIGIIYASYEKGENLNLAISSEVILDFLDKAEYSNIGTISYSDAWYMGEIKNGKRHGIGEMIWSDGSSYYGYFLNDSMTGFGSYIDENGDSYFGYLVDGLPNGLGTIQSTPSEDYIYYYIGDFVDGEEAGIGAYAYPQYGNGYIGYAKNDIFDGYGIYEYSEGQHTFANWSDNEKVGNFVGVEADGEMSVYRVVNDEWVKIK